MMSWKCVAAVKFYANGCVCFVKGLGMGTMHSFFSLQRLFSLLVVCTLAACAPAAPKDPAVSRITVIGTGDLQGHLDADPRSLRIVQSGEKIKVAGGIERIATLVRQIRQESTHPVIVLSSGDDLMGRYFHQFNGKAIYDLMGRAGYEVVSLGNHEFDRGPGVLAEALESVDFTTLCSDLIVQNTVMAGKCQPYLLREYQGIRIGFFSLMTQEFPVITLAGDVQIKPDAAIIAQEMVQTLKKQGAQLIIAVTHIGTDKDLQLAARVEGIDIIFGGHSHNYMKAMATVNQTLVVNGGEKGPALVRLDLSLNSQGRPIPSSARYTLIPVTSDIEPDANMAAQLTRYWKQLPATTVVGATEMEWDLRSSVLRTRESAVANMITDMIRKRFAADIVLFNSGSFRGDSKYPPGPVTDTRLAAIDEFECTIFLMRMQGKYIQQILEHSAALRGGGGFLQGAGLRYVLEPAGQAQQLSAPGKGDTTVVRPGSRVHDVKILSADNRWEPLRSDQYYTLATNDYLAGRGGNRFFWFKKFEHDVRNTYCSLRSVMTDYFHEHKVVNPVGPDGRIEIR